MWAARVTTGMTAVVIGVRRSDLEFSLLLLQPPTKQVKD